MVKLEHLEQNICLPSFVRFRTSAIIKYLSHSESGKKTLKISSCAKMFMNPLYSNFNSLQK